MASLKEEINSTSITFFGLQCTKHVPWGRPKTSKTNKTHNWKPILSESNTEIWSSLDEPSLLEEIRLIKGGLCIAKTNLIKATVGNPPPVVGASIKHGRWRRQKLDSVNTSSVTAPDAVLELMGRPVTRIGVRGHSARDNAWPSERLYQYHVSPGRIVTC